MEKLMQYVWQHRLWRPSALTTVDGEPVEIIDPGLLNSDAGPDFFNAKVRIGRRMWAGNVEIHVRASDWHRHGHSDDRAYDSVILHVVAADDARIARPDGNIIPQIVMDCADDFNARYRSIVDNNSAELPCAARLADVPAIYRTDWLTSLAFERIYAKADHFDSIVKKLDYDWRAALYVLLARALGFSTNSDPFERLALATPLPALMRHQRNLTAIEAALFGQAGLLDIDLPAGPEADYVADLRRDYAFMASKYSLRNPGNLGWKLARMRPQNFPHRRIAFLARLVCDGFAIGTSLPGVETLAQARELFNSDISPFWASHYTFAPTGERTARHLGAKAVDSLIINVVIPALYSHGNKYGGKDRIYACVDLLQCLPPENNRIIRCFTDAGLDCPDAFTGQALIQLKRNYCDQRKCLYCRFARRILTSKQL